MITSQLPSSSSSSSSSKLSSSDTLVMSSALDFLRELGRRLSDCVATEDVCETTFLFQRLSVIIQRYSSVLIYESFGDLDLESDL